MLNVHNGRRFSSCCPLLRIHIWTMREVPLLWILCCTVATNIHWFDWCGRFNRKSVTLIHVYHINWNRKFLVALLIIQSSEFKLEMKVFRPLNFDVILTKTSKEFIFVENVPKLNCYWFLDEKFSGQRFQSHDHSNRNFVVTMKNV